MNPQIQTWAGPKGNKYASRFFWTPAQVDAHWLKHYSMIPRTELVKEALKNIPRVAQVLEVGCNVGNQLEILKELGFKNLYGTDINASAIAIMAKRRPWIKGQVADTTKLPYPDKSFDMVMTCWTLCHMARKEFELAVKEIGRVVRPNGYIFFSEPYSSSEIEVQKDYYWSRNPAAYLPGETVSHRWVTNQKAGPTTGVFLMRAKDWKD